MSASKAGGCGQEHRESAADPRKRMSWRTLLTLALASVVCLGAGEVDSRLSEAVLEGRQDVVRRLIAQGVNVNAVEADGTTMLHWATRSNDMEMVRLLLRAGAAPNASNRYGVVPLAVAALNGNADIMTALLEAGADPDISSPEGETALMTAARTGSVPGLRVLLSRGVDVNARERWHEQTALMWAAAENHADAVRVLIEHGAEINARAAVLEGEPKRNIVDFRTAKDGLALQALLTSFPRGGLTPLLLAAREGALEAARVLAAASADLNLTDPDGISPTTMAIINGHYDLAAMLIERGADVTVAEPATGRTPLWTAIDMHTVEWVPNRPAPKPSGSTDSLDIARMLLDRGADPNARLVRGVPARKADAANHPLLGAGATPLMRAATSTDVPAMQLLLEKGADPNILTELGTTTLMLAAGLGWRDLYGQGTEQQAIEAITLCLDRGADVNATNSQGNTALHGAASRGSEAIIRFLVSRGARLDVKNKRGRTPLNEAEEQRPARDEAIALLQRLARQP